MTDSPRLLRPKPRRPFELPSNESSRPPSPPSINTAANTSSSPTDLLDVKSDLDGKRTGSLLNLTSSTLLGIFQQTAFDSGRDENSPWDTQVNTPIETDARFPSMVAGGAKPLASQIQQQQQQHTRRTGNAFYVSLISKTSLLFVCGVAYGTIMAHLHENNWITPVKLELIDRNSYVYLAAWGFGGVSLAFVLPWLDNLWENALAERKKPFANGYQKVGGRATGGDSRTSRWTLAVRSIGAFVGIAFAMRRLPWESTTQESLTLALVNPFLWYLIDRTKTGFWLSTIVALTGMGITLALHPQIIPSSTTGGLGLRNWRLAHDIQGGLTQEGMAVAIWLASAFYSACVCFGNIGRQLALGGSQQEAAKR